MRPRHVLPSAAVLLLALGCKPGQDPDAELSPVEAVAEVEVADGGDGGGSSGGKGSRETHSYWGWHPEPAGGWCRIEGRHRHPYLLADRDYAIQVVGGVVYFVGDALAWRWGGPVWWYYGHHRVAAGVWCLVDGPHTHPYKPTSGTFRAEGSYYVWSADWDADYTILVKKHHHKLNELVKVRLAPIPSHPRVDWVVRAGPAVDHGRVKARVVLPPPPVIRIDVDPPGPRPPHGHPGGLDVGVRIDASPSGSHGTRRDRDDGHHYVGGDHTREGSSRDERDGVRITSTPSGSHDDRDGKDRRPGPSTSGRHERDDRDDRDRDARTTRERDDRHDRDGRSESTSGKQGSAGDERRGASTDRDRKRDDGGQPRDRASKGRSSDESSSKGKSKSRERDKDKEGERE